MVNWMHFLKTTMIMGVSRRLVLLYSQEANENNEAFILKENEENPY